MKKLFIICTLMILIILIVPSTVSINYKSDLTTLKINNVFVEPWVEGPVEGRAGVEYTYCIHGTDDLEAEGLYAYFDWGDRTNSGWIGPYLTGENISASHTWETGKYFLQINLRNESNQWWITWAAWIFITEKSRQIIKPLISHFLEKFSLLMQFLNLHRFNKFQRI